MSERLQFGRVAATVADVVDAGFELLPHFEMAAIPVLENADRPAEWPEVRRRLQAEGLRTKRHRGVLFVKPGELDRFSSVGMFRGLDEVLLMAEWNEELESFPGRITSDLHDFNEGTPLGLEEWMIDAGCMLALGDGQGLNFATLDPELAARLRKRFKLARAR
jgi:hypothetical protein